MVGYGKNPIDPKWPNKSRLAVQFVLNYEEGGENCILHGDAASEAYLSELAGVQPLPGLRNLNIESTYEYGSRAGFWRLYRIFTKRKVPVTVYGVTTALEKNPEAVAAMNQANWEIACHGYKWIDYMHMPGEAERDQMKKAIEIQTKITGSRPLGWYTGRISINTRRLVVEEGGFLYDSDSYADDLPYWNHEYGRPHLIIPYTLDINDLKFTTHGMNTSDEFFTYLKASFDVLYAEGEYAPKMMNIGLHCRLAGKPGRAAAIIKFLDYIQKYNDIWLCKRIDIAHHWHKFHKP